MLENTLKIVYKGFNENLEGLVSSLLIENGFEFYGSGMNYMTGERDIVFDVPSRLRGNKEHGGESNCSRK